MPDFNLKRLLLFGGNRKNEDGPLLSLALNAVKFIDEVVIFTEDQHFNLPTQNGQSLRQKLEENKIKGLKWIITEKINLQLLKEYINENTMGLLINAVWIVKQDIIDSFEGKLFNYHNTRLPWERGAAQYSWKILSQSRDGALTVHKVVTRIDAGDIVKQKKLIYPEECRVPADFYRYMEKYETTFLVDFLKGKELVCIQQNEPESIYFPKLNTMLNGFINWEWSAKEIELFISAFDDPHEGASTFFQKRRLHLKKCFQTAEAKKFHSFQAGIIYRKTSGCLFVAARGGELEIKEVFDNNGKDILSKMKIGQRFHTPYHFLDEAKTAKTLSPHTQLSKK